MRTHAEVRRFVRRSKLVALAWLGLAAGACDSQTTGPDTELSETQLRYRLDDRYDIFFCDPDYYPVVRGDEQERAIETFPLIAADTAKLNAILDHLGLLGQTDFTPAEKLTIYREEKRLASITFEPAGTRFTFGLRASEGDDTWYVSGTIDRAGRIVVRERSPSSRICPICLSDETRIATRVGDVRISDLTEGTLVWTRDGHGRRILAPARVIGSVPVPLGHQFVRLRLADGRELLGSPGHPVPDGRRLADLRAGDLVDGARVVAVGRTAAQGRTWDLLPAGPTGVYWANGVPLASTLVQPDQR